MIFLQPFALAAIPLIAIPLLIHWLNHRRHKPLPWAAMHFLRQSQKFNKGMARIRYWFLLLVRMAAIAAVLFVVSRPVQTDFLASWTGAAPNIVVVLDRSPSMQTIDASTGLSKCESALQRLDQMFKEVGGNSRRVLFSYPDQAPVELPEDLSLTETLQASGVDASADIPNTLISATEWAKENLTGPVDFWICSDLRENDWNSTSSRWADVRSALSALPAYRLNLLTAEADQGFNACVTVKQVQRRQNSNRAELHVDLQVTQTSGSTEARSVPLTFEVGGVRTTLEAEMVGRELSLSGVSIPIDAEMEYGFGTVRIPVDSNSADNCYRFVFSKPTDVRVLVVADRDDIGSLLSLTLETPPDPHQPALKIQVLTPSELGAVDWQGVALVAWQSELPTGPIATQLQQLVDRGGTVFFFPPERTSDPATSGSFAGVRWGEWQNANGTSNAWKIADWRGDSDLLKNSSTNEPLALGDIRVASHCQLLGEDFVPLATLETTGLHPLLARAISDRGHVYFFATWPTAEHSNLSDEGIVFYVMIQRALQLGLASAGTTQLVNADSKLMVDWSRWNRLDKDERVVVDEERPLCSAVYQQADQLMAINRSASEDGTTIVSEEDLKKLFNGTHYFHVSDQKQAAGTLAREIWYWFVMALLFCLLGEAWLTLPKVSVPSNRSLSPSMTPELRSYAKSVAGGK